MARFRMICWLTSIALLVSLMGCTTLFVNSSDRAENVLSQERMKELRMTPYQPKFISYEVKVHEVVTGADVPKDTFLFYNADFAGVEPELKPGMEIIAVVKKGTTGKQVDGYSFTRYGTYYIVDGDYVLAAYEGESEELRDFTEKTNGIQLDSFMDKIKNLPSG